ncbi:hypothetical protein [Acinetobacter sp. AS167]|uniref:hypothetical protein n=1 Tax=Acinetobacter sp. AS167 TaxID=3127884 RepID=UPI00301655C0
MSKKTIICLWWLKDKNFKILIGNLSLKLRIGILKILILMAVKLDCKESILKISSKELLLDIKVIVASLNWLSNIKMITLVGVKGEADNIQHLVKYSFQEETLRELYQDCWVELPNYKILKFIRKTNNNQSITYEAIINYLMMIKGPKKHSNHLEQLIYDEEYLKGNYKGTWRELLVKYGLVEFLEVYYVEIY